MTLKSFLFIALALAFSFAFYGLVRKKVNLVAMPGLFIETLLVSPIALGFIQYMADWLIDYNTKIPHHSLLMKTPVEYLLEKCPECHMLWTNTDVITITKKVV